MFDSIKKFFQQLQQPEHPEHPEHHNNLEAYIISHNPQTIHDVDRLEREFDRLQNREHFIVSYRQE